MPVPFLLHVAQNGLPENIANNFWTAVYSIATVAFLVLLKKFTAGRTNTSTRALHGKVVMLTGGTTGIGARVANDLASRGAQLVLLTHVPPSDPFLAEYIQDLRDTHDNQLIYAEQVDLSSLHSIRKFATRWIDNAPPRRLDMIILCAATLTPPGHERKVTEEGIEETWQVNFLANFHLLSILSPALRAQPIDRDVRVIITTCSSYIRAPPLSEATEEKTWSPTTAYARSKLALTTFGHAYQKHLDAYKRPDGGMMNSRVIFADPGLCRTAGMRRWLTKGSLWNLAIYVLCYGIPWILLKSPEQGAQSILYAAQEASLGRGAGGRLIKECRERNFARSDITDEEVAKKLWEESDALIERTEKIAAKKRAAAKKADDEKPAKKEKDADTESITSIKKSRSKDKDKSKKDKEKKEKREKKDKERSSGSDKEKSKSKRKSKRLES